MKNLIAIALLSTAIVRSAAYAQLNLSIAPHRPRRLLPQVPKR